MSGIDAVFQYNGVANKLFVAPGVNIYAIKQRLQTMIHIPPPEIEIYYNGYVLGDDEELLNYGCPSDSIFIVERVCPVPIDSMDIVRSFILSGSLSQLEESNIELFLRQWYDVFEDIDITMKTYPVQDAPSITYILLIFSSEAFMKSAYDIAPSEIFDIPVTKQEASIYHKSLVNKTMSHFLQKTLTTTSLIASSVKQTYDSTLRPGVDQIAGETKQLFTDLDQNLHINEGIQALSESVKELDTQYNISSSIGSFLSNSFNYLKSVGNSIDQSLAYNEHTQEVYNGIKDTFKGIQSGLVETVRDANTHAVTAISNDENQEAKDAQEKQKEIQKTIPGVYVVPSSGLPQDSENNEPKP